MKQFLADNPLFNECLIKEYRMSETIRPRLATALLLGQDAGLKGFAKYVKNSTERFHEGTYFIDMCRNALEVIQLAVFMAVQEYTTDQRLFAMRPEVAKLLINIFQEIDPVIDDGIKQNSVFTVEHRRAIPLALALILRQAMTMDETISKQMFADVIGSFAGLSPAWYPAVTACIWKIRLWKKYFCTGKMELRVVGVDTMAHDLVTFYTEHPIAREGQVRTQNIRPEFQCIAQYLVKEKIVEYLVGDSSHPQLIARASNIIGFLVITNNFTTEKADLVWETLVMNEDRRVPDALFTSLAPVCKTLTQVEEELYLCKKISWRPIPVFSSDSQIFILALLEKLRSRVATKQVDSEQFVTIVTTCVDLMCQCVEATPATPVTYQVRRDASLTIATVSQDMSTELRHQVYRDWVSCIENRQPPEHIYMQAIWTMIQYQSEQDVHYLAKELQLTKIAMQSYSDFVRTSKTNPTNTRSDRQREIEELESRLGLILNLLGSCTDSAPADICMMFWNHLVGPDALNNGTRDFAWKELAKLADDPQKSRREALNSLYGMFLPTIRPDNFTPSFITFVEKLAKMNLPDVDPTNEGAEGVLKLPGVDLMWRVMLMAPEGSGEDSAMGFLARLWMNKSIEQLTNESVEENHKSMVQFCVKRMNEAYNFIRSQSPQNANASPEDSDMMDTTDPDKCHYEERAFCRCVSFLRILMNYIRARPDMVRSLPYPPPLEVAESGIINGEPVTIKYQVWPSGEGRDTGPICEVVVGDLETRRELHERVCKWAKFSNFRLFWGGRSVNLLEKPMETLRDFKAQSKTLMMIKQDATSSRQDQLTSSPSFYVKTVFDREIIQNFDTLYKFMDSEDRISNAVYELLEWYRPHESICHNVADTNIDPAKIFPIGHLYKSHYSLRCLDSVFEEQKTQGELDQNFLLHGIHSLEWLLIKRPLPTDQVDLPKYLSTFEWSVSIFTKLLQAVEVTETSPFDDGKAVVERLVKVLQLFLLSPISPKIIHEGFELVISAIIACTDAWDAFQELEDLASLHEELLLSSMNPTLRGNIATILRTSLNRFTGNSHLSLKDFSQFYWRGVAALIDIAPTKPMFSEELFTLAEQLVQLRFKEDGKTIDADNLELLKQYWGDWSFILTSYQKNEFVGREITDPVILGLSNLLCLTFQYLKESDAAPETNDLTEKLWFNLLFPDTPQEDDSSGMEYEIPLLDSRTRASVYKLLDAIMLDNGFKNLLKAAEWVNGVSLDKSDDPARWVVDRTRLIRPDSGYLGLRNLGNTCYMNSLLTQLYMNPAFRAFLINQPVSDPDHKALLFQTQMLFSRMQNGYGPFGDPTFVARNIRTYFDEAINVHEQMDVEEFFNLLFDQWENQLEIPAAKEAFRRFYGGTLVNQIKSKECPHISETEERYLNIQCDVQGKQTLADSLQAFVEGDVMQGDNKYKCEKCGGKLVNAVRRACLKEIPDNLILHLKRFEYDIGAQRRSKINDFFSFPSSIDMKPYTSEYDKKDSARSTEPDMFELVGVLVHKGQAEHGHYISYIRTRPASNTQPSMWLLFDDNEVTIFDPNELADACYGGIAQKEGGYGPLHPSFKAYNAYMLFYQRSSTMGRGAVPETNGHSSSVAPVPEHIARIINCENALDLRNYCLFGEPHSIFVKNMMLKLKTMDHEIEFEANNLHETQREIIGASLQHLWRVSSRAKDLPDYANKLDILSEVAADCHCCGLLIFSWFSLHVWELRDMLVRSALPKVRQTMQQFLVSTLYKIRDTPVYGFDAGQTQNDIPKHDLEQNGALFMMLNISMTIALQELHHHMRGFDEFFNMLLKIASFGPAEAMFMILRGFFTLCLEFLTMHKDPNLKQKHRQTLGLIERRPVIFNNLAEFLCLMMRYVILSETYKDEADHVVETPDGNKLLRIRPEDRALMSITEDGGLAWMNRMFDKWDPSKEEHAHFAPESMICMIVDQDKSTYMTTCIAQTLKDGIESAITLESELCIRAARGMLAVCPSLSLIRGIIKSVNRVVNDSDGQSANILYGFYDSLKSITNRHFEPPAPGNGSFYKEACLYANQYGPALLVHPDEPLVRYQMGALLDDLFLSLPPISDPTAGEPSEMDIVRVESVRRLLQASSVRIGPYLEQDYAKQFLQPMMTVMKACTEFLRAIWTVDEYSDLRDESGSKDKALMEAYQGKCLERCAFLKQPWKLTMNVNSS
jgi:ubiquitin carboxyl-terminal hydrolase 34